MGARACLILVLVLLSARAHGQDAPSRPEEPEAGLDVHGAADVGYRWTTIDGSTASYDRLFDLSRGLRLLSIDLTGTAPKGSTAFAESFAFSLSGIGDPFPAAQFTMKKARRYDARVTWRMSRLRDAWPATPPSIDGLDTRAVTDRHSWSTSRQLGNASLVYDVGNRLHALVNYARTVRTGTLVSTRALEFVGAPAAWGTFARANPYPVVSPVDDAASRFTAGLSYSTNRWTLNYQAGVHRIDEHTTLSPETAPERSINVADAATASELLTSLAISQSRRLTAPISEWSYVVRPASRLEWRGHYFFARYRGPFTAAARYQGSARTNASGTYDISSNADGIVVAPSHVVGQTLTYRAGNRWTLDADYRYSRYTTDASGRSDSAVSGVPGAAPQASATDEESWRQTSHALGVGMTVEPSAAWTIRPGVRVVDRNVERRIDGVVDAGTTERSTTIWPELTVAYRPAPQLSARGSYRRASSDRAYTRLSPVDRTIGSALLRYQPAEPLTLDVTANLSDAEAPSAAFVSHLRAVSVDGSYKLLEHATLVAGVDYSAFLGLGTVSFLRGTAPIADDELRDRERDFVWRVGAVVPVGSRIEIRATANVLRTTGTDAVAGEPPLYGPTRSLYGTGSVRVDLPRLGQVSFDLSRARWEQDILSLNDFRATWLTVRLARRF